MRARGKLLSQTLLYLASVGSVATYNDAPMLSIVRRYSDLLLVKVSNLAASRVCLPD